MLQDNTFGMQFTMMYNFNFNSKKVKLNIGEFYLKKKIMIW